MEPQLPPNKTSQAQDTTGFSLVKLQLPPKNRGASANDSVKVSSVVRRKLKLTRLKPVGSKLNIPRFQAGSKLKSAILHRRIFTHNFISVECLNFFDLGIVYKKRFRV
jgi:hypothetical protein